MKILLFLASFLISVSVQALEGDTFTSQTLGFSIAKPTSWVFVSANNYIENLKQVKLNDKEAQKQFQEALRAPLVVMSKTSSEYNAINPNFKVDVKPAQRFPRGAQGIDVVNMIVNGIRKANVVKNLIIEEPPKKLLLAEHKAGYVKMSYKTVSSTGVEIPLESHIWVIPNQNNIYIIGGSYMQGDNESAAEIIKISETIKIEFS